MDDREHPDGRPGRERELASLYAVARSLTALGDVEDVLDSIVRHAHELIGTDFTYLSLLDDDGVLRITASEGTISAAFRSAHIPPGTGLGGKVIASRAAHWVDDYAQAVDLRHHPGFDALVGNEGLVALLGVPLVARDRVLGALFAAHRSRRRFRTDEIALLSAFADHAAIALDNARLYEESRGALSELTSAYRTIEQQVAVMERAQSVHEALTEVVLAGGGPGVVAAELADRMGGAVTILDRRGEPLARSDGDPRDVREADPAALHEVIDRARTTGRAATAGGGGRPLPQRGDHPRRRQRARDAGVEPGRRARHRGRAEPRAGGPRRRAAHPQGERGGRRRRPPQRRAAHRADRDQPRPHRYPAVPRPLARDRPRRARRPPRGGSGHHRR
ncbi:GAF domain-containing protein [Nocardioides sp. TF02-7]|uniref:GAF domain-containing protein n=1 Tax=Nocardioides sp. TF02-7 TaxID=2917724 RepID=UPI001F055B10|nr:GAF domain-containing protein [Nocardioides sp. TF02-7]UMG91737.1 GAF domain-containing protein [Nocardioides sp. TF02-7]